MNNNNNNNKEYYKVDLNKSDYDSKSSDYKLVDSKSVDRRNLKLLFTSLYRQISNPTLSDDAAHNKNEIRNRPNDSVVIEKQGGLTNKFVITLLFLWYLFSALTLYTNKYIITSRHIDPTLVGKIYLQNLRKFYSRYTE